MDTEKEIEQMLQDKGLNAPRLRPVDIDAVIVGVSRENFDNEIGRQISRDDARSKVWGFEAYLLQQKVFESAERG